MPRDYLSIAVAMVLTGIISVSAHVFILQYFHPPALKIDPSISELCDYAIRFFTVTSSFFIYLLSKEYWQHITLSRRFILFTILMLALTESLFRSLIMNIIVSNSWIYQILSALPTYLKFFSLSFVICILLQAASKKKQFKFLRYFLLAILATMLFILVGKIANSFIAPLLAKITNNESNIIQIPYGINILIPAYITYIEPTIASFIVFYLIKDSLLTFNTLSKGLILAGIIIAIHAGIYSLVQITYSEGDIFYRIFYYGQFLWEYLILGVLTAYSFALCWKPLSEFGVKLNVKNNVG